MRSLTLTKKDVMRTDDIIIKFLSHMIVTQSSDWCKRHKERGRSSKRNAKANLRAFLSVWPLQTLFPCRHPRSLSVETLLWWLFSSSWLKWDASRCLKNISREIIHVHYTYWYYQYLKKNMIQKISHNLKPLGEKNIWVAW